jgi:hypothetical protein
MITTLNPKVTKVLMFVSILISLYAIGQNKIAAITFLIGAVASFPIIYNVWVVMEKNWNSLYKKFYAKGFHKRDMKLVKKSFRLTWWVIPWSVIIYSPISFAITSVDPSFNLLLSYIFGSIFVISLVTYIRAKKYSRYVT